MNLEILQELAFLHVRVSKMIFLIATTNIVTELYGYVLYYYYHGHVRLLPNNSQITRHLA